MRSHLTVSKPKVNHKKAYEFLKDHLPKDYSVPTQALLLKSKIKVTKDVIRNVRNQYTTSNVHVLNALIVVAKKAKQADEMLADQLK